MLHSHTGTPRRAIVIGASAGGVSALIELTAALPAELPAVVGVVLHVGRQYSILPQLLARKGTWRAVHPADGEALVPGTIYVAPPDQHMLFTGGAVRLSRGPRENHARPALDPLFRSAALEWRQRAIGVVLTGDLDDGTAGLAAIKDYGGIAIVQDPATAFQPGMPSSALANVPVDHCLALADIAPALVRLVRGEPGAPVSEPPPLVAREQAIFDGDRPIQHLAEVGRPSALSCPECGGGLWELQNVRPLRYRCHTGHAYSALSLESAQSEVAEQTLWSTVRALREREMLLRRLASVAETMGDPAQAEVGRREADRVKQRVDQLTGVAANDPAAGRGPSSRTVE